MITTSRNIASQTLLCLFIFAVLTLPSHSLNFFKNNTKIASINTQSGVLNVHANNGIVIQSSVTFNQPVSYSGLFPGVVSTANAMSAGSFGQTSFNKALKAPSSGTADCSNSSHAGRIRNSSGLFQYCNGTNWINTNITQTRYLGSHLSTGTSEFPNIDAITENEVYAGYIDKTTNKVVVQRWNGSTWTTVGSAVGIGTCNNLVMDAISSTLIYVAFTDSSDANNVQVHKWDGTQWSKIGSSLGGNNFTGFVDMDVLSGNDIYASFYDASTSWGVRVFHWNGSTWNQLGTYLLGTGNQATGYANLSVVSSNEVYVTYQDHGDSYKCVVYKWNGTAWTKLGSTLGSGFTAFHDILAVSSANVIVGFGIGNKTEVYQWNGSTWTQLGSALGTSTTELHLSINNGSDIYVSLGDTGGGKTYKWSGTSWTLVAPGVGSGRRYKLSILDTNQLYLIFRDAATGYKTRVYALENY